MCLLLYAAPVSASDDPYLAVLESRAAEKGLAGERYWYVLMHYRKTLLGVTSRIDDPSFFLSPKGKTDPEAELNATLRGFFEPHGSKTEHPQCKFIARYSWLKEQLEFDESRLPPVECRAFNEALTLIDPSSVVLVFPNAFMNDPASMFGHTFLRIDGHYESRLLSYAVNYAAITGRSSNTVAYALKGLFGYYKGLYSAMPYYFKVNEYNDIEQRDMWEYRLGLTEEEVLRMVRHLWELKDVYSYYYFFDENCSYNLFFLLEAARPALDFTSRRNFWTIPVDTVRAMEKEGLVQSVSYRPSRATRIMHVSSSLDREELETVKNVLDGSTAPEEITACNGSRGARILDLAAEILQYRYAKKKIGKPRYQDELVKLLNARTGYTVAVENNEIPVPERPEEGHHSARFNVSAGVRGDDFFQEVKIRPAYHDLLDADRGYVKGSQIVFTDLALRYYPGQKKFVLQNLDVIDIVSLSPLDTFFKAKSWKVYTGIDRQRVSREDEELVFRLNPGVGVTVKNEILGLGAVFAEADLNAASSMKPAYALGFGISATVIKEIAEFWKAMFAARGMTYEIGAKHKSYRATIGQNFSLSQNYSIRVDISREKVFGKYRTEMELGLNVYF